MITIQTNNSQRRKLTDMGPKLTRNIRQLNKYNKNLIFFANFGTQEIEFIQY